MSKRFSPMVFVLLVVSVCGSDDTLLAKESELTSALIPPPKELTDRLTSEQLGLLASAWNAVQGCCYSCDNWCDPCCSGASAKELSLSRDANLTALGAAKELTLGDFGAPKAIEDKLTLSLTGTGNRRLLQA